MLLYHYFVMAKEAFISTPVCYYWLEATEALGCCPHKVICGEREAFHTKLIIFTAVEFQSDFRSSLDVFVNSEQHTLTNSGHDLWWHDEWSWCHTLARALILLVRICSQDSIHWKNIAAKVHLPSIVVQSPELVLLSQINMYVHAYVYCTLYYIGAQGEQRAFTPNCFPWCDHSSEINTSKRWSCRALRNVLPWTASFFCWRILEFSPSSSWSRPWIADAGNLHYYVN